VDSRSTFARQSQLYTTKINAKSLIQRAKCPRKSWLAECSWSTEGYNPAFRDVGCGLDSEDISSSYIDMKIALPIKLHLVAVLCLVASAPAQDRPIQELFQTEIVYPQDKGEVQFTLSPAIHLSGKDRTVELPLRSEYGITDSLQLGFGWRPPQLLSTASGSGTGATLELGAKYSVMNVGQSHNHVALGFELAVPTHKQAQAAATYTPFVVVAHDFPALMSTQVFAEVGVQMSRTGPGPDDIPAHRTLATQLQSNLGFFVPLRRMTLTQELSRAGSELYYTPGVAWKVSGWELAAGMTRGLTQQSEAWSPILKVTHEFHSRPDISLYSATPSKQGSPARHG